MSGLEFAYKLLETRRSPHSKNINGATNPNIKNQHRNVTTTTRQIYHDYKALTRQLQCAYTFSSPLSIYTNSGIATKMKPMTPSRLARLHATPKYKAHLAREMQRIELQITGLKTIVAVAVFGISYVGYKLGQWNMEDEKEGKAGGKEWK